MAQKNHLNTLLDTMIMMLLDHWLIISEKLKVIQQCPLRLAINNC